MTDAAVRYLVEGAQRFGLELREVEALELLRFKDELLAWNRRFNLTALTADEAVLEKHFLDSLAVWTSAELADGMRVIDLGTGAGMPGLLLAIYSRSRVPGLRWVLVDANRKKVGFVQHMIDFMGLENATCIQARAEDLGRQKAFRETFDRGIARAVAPLVVLCEYGLPLIRVGGRFLAMKGPKGADEIEEARYAIQALGGTLAGVDEYALPYSQDRRLLVIIEKQRPTPDAYPRRAGVPSRSPLKEAGRMSSNVER